MNYLKDLMLARQNGEIGPDDHLEDIDRLKELATMLHGELDGHKIACPAPGELKTDRSLVFYINPDNPREFYIYDFPGDEERARKWIWSKVYRLDLGPPRDRTGEIDQVSRESVPVADTIAEIYLRRHRGITIPIPDCLRFHKQLYLQEHRACAPTPWPGMIAYRIAPDFHTVVSVHKTLLDPVSSQKALLFNVKTDLGPVKETAIHLTPPARRLLIGEGIETVLSAMQLLLQHPDEGAWAVGSCKNLRNLPLPDETRSVSLLVDRDKFGHGLRACTEAGVRYQREGREVELLWPDYEGVEYNDFNNLLRAQRGSK